MRLAEDVQDLGVIEQRPNQDGRNMTMMLGPVKKKDAPAHKGDGDGGQAEAPAPAEATAQA
jgi:translation initiation factor IF-3